MASTMAGVTEHLGTKRIGIKNKNHETFLRSFDCNSQNIVGIEMEIREAPLKGRVGE